MAEINARGFEQYGDIETHYGHTIRVYESSSAMGPCVWINTVRPERADGGVLRPEETTAHLTLVQAIRLKDLLIEFIDGVPQRWERGRHLLSKAHEEIRKRWPQQAVESDRRYCQCCYYGNHDIQCICDGAECCHPERHPEQAQDAAVSALRRLVGPDVPSERLKGVLEALVVSLRPLECACGMTWWGEIPVGHGEDRCPWPEEYPCQTCGLYIGEHQQTMTDHVYRRPTDDPGCTFCGHMKYEHDGRGCIVCATAHPYIVRVTTREEEKES